MFNALKSTDEAYRADGLVWRMQLGGPPKVGCGGCRGRRGRSPRACRLQAGGWGLPEAVLPGAPAHLPADATLQDALQYVCIAMLCAPGRGVQVGLRGVGFLFKEQMAQYDEEIVSK